MLDRAAGEDRSAIDRLLAAHREPLRRMIAARLDRALARREDASDVVQGVLLEASRRLADYLRHPSMPFPLWIRQIARDQLIDVHRRHRLAGRRSVDRERSLTAHEFFDRSSLDLASALRDQGPTPAAEAIRNELVARFHAALEQLGEEDREIVFMRHFEHLTNSETAAALGLSEPAAGMRYLRALRRLRAVLAARPDEVQHA
ncbi:MAG TPA: sigma-70 family RNA polymerase sigma factor [Isosphaeraceae bacterium]|nr:sigma-70 family RNA polymerase sigma factor [Isosphaeraceae bacterium]